MRNALANRRLAELRRLIRFRNPGMPLDEVDSTIFTTAPAVTKQSARVCGEAFALTLQERVDLHIRTIRAANVSHAEAQAFYRERKRKRDRARQQRQRDLRKARREAGTDLADRDENVFLVMGNEWCTVADIAKWVEWYRPDGRRLPRESLRRAIRRSLDALLAKGLIVAETIVGSHGQPVLRVQRKFDLIGVRRDFVTGTPGHQDKISSPHRT